MTSVDTRQDSRDSLFLLATLRVDGGAEEFRVKVRNLSSGGMMAEGEVLVARGSRVAVSLRNIGWIEGAVAWKQGNRFGIAFAEEIDPLMVRSLPEAAAETGFESPMYTRGLPTPVEVDPRRLRKI